MRTIKNKTSKQLGIFFRYPKASLVLVNLISFFSLLVVTEIVLRFLAPIAISNVGFLHTPNGLRFGWGFEPYGLVRIEDPDTGTISSDRVNNMGWRDRDRTYKNPNNAFRVLLLGDSTTFGFIVPKKKTYAWILEDRMRVEGMNVEILNISYPGWSTSQELEALEKEGMKYRPDMVIVNFVGNDISDNVSHKGSGKFANRIPFFHEVTFGGKLVRRDNPNFIKERRAITRQFLLSKSEVLKMFWLLRLAIKHAFRPSHIIASGQINLLNAVLAGSNSGRFMKKLKILKIVK